jgi:hypothetical protein
VQALIDVDELLGCNHLAPVHLPSGFERLSRLIHPTGVEVEKSECELRIGVLWIERDRTPQRRLGIAIPPGAAIRVAQLRLRHGAVVIELNGALEQVDLTP